jgi:hypothetical protein
LGWLTCFGMADRLGMTFWDDRPDLEA